MGEAVEGWGCRWRRVREKWTNDHRSLTQPSRRIFVAVRCQKSMSRRNLNKPRARARVRSFFGLRRGGERREPKIKNPDENPADCKSYKSRHKTGRVFYQRNKMPRVYGFSVFVCAAVFFLFFYPLRLVRKQTIFRKGRGRNIKNKKRTVRAGNREYTKIRNIRTRARVYK